MLSAAGVCCPFWSGQIEELAVDQSAGRDERSDLGVAELAEQAPDVAVDRFRPDRLSRTEIAAHHCRRDPRIDGRRIERHQSPLAVTRHADLAARRAATGEAVHGRQDFLHLVADHVPPHVERLPVNPFAIGLVALAELPVVRGQLLAADERRQHDFKPAFSQPPRPLPTGRQPLGQAQEHFGRLIGVGNRNHAPGGLVFRPYQEPFAEHAFQHRPADLVDFISRRCRHPRRIGVVAKLLQRSGSPRIDRPDDLAETLAVRFDGLPVRLGRTEILFPVRFAAFDRFGDFSLDEPVRAVHHRRRQVFLLPLQRPGAGQRLDGFGQERRSKPRSRAGDGQAQHAGSGKSIGFHDFLFSWTGVRGTVPAAITPTEPCAPWAGRNRGPGHPFAASMFRSSDRAPRRLRQAGSPGPGARASAAPCAPWGRGA